MKKCKKCNSDIQTWIRINGKRHNLASRKYCLSCSPFKKHNTRKLDGTSIKASIKFFNERTEKTCAKCKKTKLVSEFYKVSKDKLYSYCRMCSTQIASEKQKIIKAKCVKYKGGKCICCGYNKCSAALDFHHPDPQIKDFQLTRIHKFNKEIMEELDKCVLLCAVCHREVHAGLIDNDQLKNLEPLYISYHSSASEYCDYTQINIPKPPNVCVDCRKEIDYKSTRCRSCAGKAVKPTKIEWPDTEILIQMVKETSFLAVSKKLGVSDNAVRKRIKKHS